VIGWQALGELERAVRRLRDAIEREDTEAALAIVGGRLTDELAELIDQLVRRARIEGTTPERCGILLNMPAETIYSALRKAGRE
jgi:hypothetical protein